MNSDGHEVAVIGGGISGLTTATLLQINGYRTSLFVDEAPGVAFLQSHRYPKFASLHAAASVLPHSVQSPKAAYWTGVSQEFFGALSFAARCGVRQQTHYEIFEEPPAAAPDYARSFRSFENLSEGDLQHHSVPRRPGAISTSGWRFDVFFCEAPEYIAFLYSLYEAAGGRVVRGASLPGKRMLVDYLRLGYQFYVNCTGHAAIDFLDTASYSEIEDDPGLPEYEPLRDQYEAKFLRGHYLRVDIKRPYVDDRGRVFSYNYTPTPDVYRSATGTAADVYCYPRSDCWILGGSRQPLTGPIDPSGSWVEEVGSEVDQEVFFRQDGEPYAIPKPIFSLNDQLLERMTRGRLSLTGIRADRPRAFIPGMGLRFQRSSASDSVRLSCSRVRFRGEKFILHNYGHGGSGFTLSWGCAYDLLTTLNLITSRVLEPEVPPDGRFQTGHSAIKSILGEITHQLIQGNITPPQIT